MPPYSFGDGPSSSEFSKFVEENARQHAELSERIDEVKADLAQHSHLVMAELTDMKDALKAIRAAVEKS